MSHREAYARGLIEIDAFERLEEARLLREAGRSHPVPEGWAPLPPCDHEWIEISGLGAAGRELLCARCGDQDWQL